MTKTSKPAKTATDPVLRELVRIRNLLMLDLLMRGLRSEDVDLAVQMGSSEVRRALPIREIKRMLKNAKEGT